MRPFIPTALAIPLALTLASPAFARAPSRTRRRDARGRKEGSDHAGNHAPDLPSGDGAAPAPRGQGVGAKTVLGENTG